MARFFVDFEKGPSTSVKGYGPATDYLETEELLEIIQPAAETLVERYKDTLRKLDLVLSGALVESIEITKTELGTSYEKDVSLTIAPAGVRKKGSRTRKSRAGSPDRKYAKHNRSVSARKLSNSELGYILEYGTTRINATHWMKNTNDACSSEIQHILTEKFDEVLRRKGLI